MNLAFMNKTISFNKKLMKMSYFEYCKDFKLPVTILYIRPASWSSGQGL